MRAVKTASHRVALVLAVVGVAIVVALLGVIIALDKIADILRMM